MDGLLKHFDQKNPNSSPGVLCQVDVCLMVLGDCFKIAFYIYFTRKIMIGHFKKPEWVVGPPNTMVIFFSDGKLEFNHPL